MSSPAMFIGQFRPSAMKEPGQEEKAPEQAQTAERSSSSEQFLATPAAKEFVSTWTEREKDGRPVATRRGVTDLLGALHRNSGLSDKQVIKETDRILMKLTGLDGFSGAMSKLKAATEGLFKGLKAAMGGG